MTDDLDFTHALKAKSDQLNADDMIGGPITVQIIGAQVRKREERPVTIKISGGHMPWYPCKGMLGILADAAGSASMRPWLGMWVTLFRDPPETGRVLWAGKPDSGIRIAAIDSRILPNRRDFRVRVGRNNYTHYTVDSLQARREDGAPTADLAAWLADHDLTVGDVDAWRESKGKGSLADLPDDDRARFAGWLASNPVALDEIRALIPQE